MADDKPEDTGLAPESGRAKRTPPTIDLEATEVSTQPHEVAGEPEAQPATGQAGDEQAKFEEAKFEETKFEETKAEPQPEAAERPSVAAAPVSPSISPWVIAPVSGAAAAAVVIGVGWMLGWPAVQAPPAAPQVTSATVDALNGRVAAVEAKAGKPAADPALLARIDALEKSASSLRSDIASLRAQSDKTASALNDAKSAPRDAASADLANRIAQLERASKTDRAELAQQSEKIADARTMDDKALRHVVAAALLDVAVRHGDAYGPQLAAARSLAAKPDGLKPLDTFASSGIPTPVALSRELLNIVPKLSPPAEAQSGGAGIVERLQAGASKLVRIERTDGVGNDRGAIVSRVTAAALRNDFVEARRELKSLPEADRAPAQAWLDKTDARDAALAASRKFADDAMADLVKPAQ
ncbi:COG4223 family protein [Bradyrhizobium sp. Bra78]|uniref:COG4223 family protein n=1 Tax=Bradyrhizobium sp. Bra78 TaxID=2926010 RepID=UPI0021C909F3|nr:hypothetical protein [Bradyrhizobium sp. Bra78]